MNRFLEEASLDLFYTRGQCKGVTVPQAGGLSKLSSPCRHAEMTRGCNEPRGDSLTGHTQPFGTWERTSLEQEGLFNPPTPEAKPAFPSDRNRRDLQQPDR